VVSLLSRFRDLKKTRSFFCDFCEKYIFYSPCSPCLRGDFIVEIAKEISSPALRMTFKRLRGPQRGCRGLLLLRTVFARVDQIAVAITRSRNRRIGPLPAGISGVRYALSAYQFVQIDRSSRGLWILVPSLGRGKIMWPRWGMGQPFTRNKRSYAAAGIKSHRSLISATSFCCAQRGMLDTGAECSVRCLDRRGDRGVFSRCSKCCPMPPSSAT